jgi:hypothetical protein
MLRALVAPSDSAVCPTSRTIRKLAGSHVVASGLKAERFGAAGLKAASFTALCFSETLAAGFRTAMCVGDLPCFDELLKISDSHAASLTSIGRSINAAIAAPMVRRRGQTLKPDPANCIPDDSNPFNPLHRALISENLESARSNLTLKSHIASRISRKVADVLFLSVRPKEKMLLFLRYPMIVGSEIL